MPDADREPELDAEHQVTPLELFFDLTFVFAMTQVTVLLADDSTWNGVFRGMLVLTAIWWAWSTYAWLPSWRTRRSATASTGSRSGTPR